VTPRAPPPFPWNPSRWRQRIPICALAGVAAILSAWMACYQWRVVPGVWDPVFGAQTRRVLDSAVSGRMRAWIGIPDAALGSIAYLGDVLFGLAGSTRRWQYRPWLVILFGIDVIPLGLVSVLLVILQGLVVGQWCFLCIVSALISLILVVMAGDEVLVSLLYLRRVYRHTESGREVWDALRGRASAAADEVAFGMPVERRV